MPVVVLVPQHAPIERRPDRVDEQLDVAGLVDGGVGRRQRRRPVDHAAAADPGRGDGSATRVGVDGGVGRLRLAETAEMVHADRRRPERQRTGGDDGGVRRRRRTRASTDQGRQPVRLFGDQHHAARLDEAGERGDIQVRRPLLRRHQHEHVGGRVGAEAHHRIERPLHDVTQTAQQQEPGLAAGGPAGEAGAAHAEAFVRRRDHRGGAGDEEHQCPGGEDDD